MSLFCSVIFAMLIWFSVHGIIYGNKHSDKVTETFIVSIQNDMKPTNYLDTKEWYKSILNKSNANCDLLYVYSTVFRGFSAQLTHEQANFLRDQPEVIGIFPDEFYQLHTTRSPHFLGLTSYKNPKGLLKESDLGSNIVIGVFDSGIWPESPSFTDEGLSNVPSHFKGQCDGGEDFPSTLCNKKIIGIRYFSHGIMATTEGLGTNEVNSGRDYNGHGTHTASTAAGRSRPYNASFFGYAKGEAIGIAPNARLSIYKVCWMRGCVGSDVIAAFDKAVEDGVDIISISLGGPSNRYSYDSIAIGAFAAIEKGIFVSASAGNSGPSLGKVSNNAPWLTTVGASTIDRSFPADLVLENNETFTGTSLYTGVPLPKNQTYPIIHFASNWSMSHCMPNSLDKKDVAGAIVICLPGLISAVEKGMNVQKVGGIGVVIANVAAVGDDTLVSRPFLIPGLTISYVASNKLLSYIHKQTMNATIVFRGTMIGEEHAPVVAWFSSRGPSSQSIYILKPDMISPGVDILAAWPDNVPPSRLLEDTRRSGFNIVSGTSMSCPHVSGLAALLKGSHPDWTPSMIRSALMTTAYTGFHETKLLLHQESDTNTSVWDRGTGHVDPEKANNPGLVFDLNMDNYIDFLCAANYSISEISTIVKRSVSCKKTIDGQWDLNYPSIIVTSNQEDIVTRTLTSVASGASNYTATTIRPQGANVIVNPLMLNFTKKGDKQSFTVKISTMKNETSLKSPRVGSLLWTDGNHDVMIPLIVV